MGSGQINIKGWDERSFELRDSNLQLPQENEI